MAKAVGADSARVAVEALPGIARLRNHVAWLGETGRFGWWQTDALSPEGGGYLLQGILPKTHRWAAMQIGWACAAVVEARLVTIAKTVTLFRLGPGADARLLAWVRARKRELASPDALLPADDGAFTSPAEALDAWKLVSGKTRTPAAVPGTQTVSVGKIEADSLSSNDGLLAAAERLVTGYVHGRKGHAVIPFLEIR